MVYCYQTPRNRPTDRTQVYYFLNQLKMFNLVKFIAKVCRYVRAAVCGRWKYYQRDCIKLHQPRRFINVKLKHWRNAILSQSQNISGLQQQNVVLLLEQLNVICATDIT